MVTTNMIVRLMLTFERPNEKELRAGRYGLKNGVLTDGYPDGGEPGFVARREGNEITINTEHRLATSIEMEARRFSMDVKPYTPEGKTDGTA